MTKQPTVTFHGAAQTVTGSCMRFSLRKEAILVDCGLFQGSRTLERANFSDFDFDPSGISAVVLTHAHIDHCGLLPKLVAQGFEGAIHCTPQTRDLLEFMLADAGRIQEMEAQQHNRRRDRSDKTPFEPLYTEKDALRAWRQCRPVELCEAFDPTPSIHAKFWNAGHILGSATVELDIGGVRVVCSGDLGPEHKLFLEDAAGPAGVDHVICESTYGDRERADVTIEDRRSLLQAEVAAAMARGGNLVIPTFALERTQELLLDLAVLLDEGRIASVNVFVDSPLANEITRVFASHVGNMEDTGGENVFKRPNFRFVEETQDSIRLNSVSGAVIMAASGMCEGGRIRHHLIHNLHRRDSTILFVGYQAQGTLGRAIIDGARSVRISGNDVQVRAQIRRIESYSAHADQRELLTWIDARSPIEGSLFLTHGEPEAMEVMRRELQRRSPGLTVKLPLLGETYALAAATPAKRISTGRIDLQQATGRDWQNSYAEFASDLKERLRRIEDEDLRKKAIREMREIIDSYATSRSNRPH